MSSKLDQIKTSYAYISDVLKYPLVLTFIVTFQGCFGGMGVVQTPKILEKIVTYPAGRFFFLATIAFTATSDIQTSIIAVILFLGFLHLLRTKQEKEELRKKRIYF